MKISGKLKKLIESSVLGFATTYPSGAPHIIGVASVKVASGDKIIITNNYMRRTLKNILKNDRVCLSVIGKNWQGYEISGRARYYTDGEYFRLVGKIPANRGMPCRGAVVVSVSKVEKMA